MRASRDELVAEVVVARTDTLRDDFDVADLLHNLTAACVRAARRGRGRDAAGRRAGTAGPGRGHPRRQREARAAVDPGSGAPASTPCAESFRSAHAVPLVLRTEVVGGLNLFRRHLGPLPAGDQWIGLHLATFAAVGITHRRALRKVEGDNSQLQHALESRIIIEQAKGFVAERHHLEVTEAFDRLRSHARSRGRPLTHVASDVIEGALDLT